jgi:Domain of unknown function (DUF6379)
MFDKYLIGADTVRNVGPANAPIGFAFDARLGYYRGLGLSMIEDLAVTIDGVAVPRAAVRFRAGTRELTLDEMETAYELRWNFGAWAQISVMQPGGLTPGEHRLALTERLRISYLPFPSIVGDEKTIRIKVPGGT